MTIPNILTIMRLALVPIIVYGVIVGWYTLAFWLFVIAGLSDGVDGFIAKRFNQASELGAYLDPLADKALLVSLYVALAILGYVPAWLSILVVSRDLFILAGIGVAALMSRPMEIDPLWVSKATTAAQIALLAAILAKIGLGLDFGGVLEIGIIVVAGLTLTSAVAYLLTWIRHMSD